MPYAVFYQAATKKEIEAVWTDYGARLQEEMLEWFADLAKRAEAKDYALSFDWLELLQSGAPASTVSSWRHSLRQFLEANASQRFWALLTLLKKRCPPWELRAASHNFFVVGAFHCSITAFFEIDHGSKRIVFRYFDGLPGHG